MITAKIDTYLDDFRAFPEASKIEFIQAHIKAPGFNRFIKVYKTYLEALVTKNKDLISAIECHGRSFHTIRSNYYYYIKATELGFKNLTINKNGFYEKVTFPEKKTLSINSNSSYIEVAKSPNDFWTYGLFLQAGEVRFSSDISAATRPVFKSEEACIIGGLKTSLLWLDGEFQWDNKDKKTKRALALKNSIVTTLKSVEKKLYTLSLLEV